MEIFPEKRRLKDSFIDYNVEFFSSGNGTRVLNSGLNESYNDYKAGLFSSGKGIKAENSELDESFSGFTGGLNESYVDYNVGLFGSGDGTGVVNSELDKSFSRYFGDFDTNKRREEMLDKSIPDDMGSGIRKDYALKVCVKSESQQMNRNSKRKLLHKEDPDWSPCRENVVSERWNPERKRHRKRFVWKNGGVNVSRPAIQALPAVRMFETYWNQGGNKNKIETRAKYTSSRRGSDVSDRKTMDARGAMIIARGDSDNQKDSLEEEYDSGVSELPIVALPAPCSFNDFCTSAGWKVTLPEGAGTTIYCSPTGGIYDSPSKVLEIFSQQASKFENAQSGSYQSVHKSRTDMRAGDYKMKQYMEDESLNNEKSSSESGIGVTTKGDYDRELQGPRRSTRIKGRHVAVDFEFDAEKSVSEDGLHSSNFVELKNLYCKPEEHDMEKVEEISHSKRIFKRERNSCRWRN